MTKIGFQFPIDVADQWDGFNDPGMEHFAGDPFVHLGRETTQNSIDAPLRDPVRVCFSRISVPISEIPDVDGLRDAILACKRSAESESRKAEAFFAEAKDILAKKMVTVLKVEDFNTHGLKGPCVNGKPFFALLKASGQSKKESDTSAGTFGIGKFAPFNLSKLRTVFVSTVWKDDNGQLHHYVQGKSRLMSFVDENGKTHQATGFWGEISRCQPISGDPEKVPKWLRRAQSKASMSESDLGTTLYVMGFPEVAKWREILAATIAENFFGTIHEGKLRVEIEGGYVVDNSTLKSIFQDETLCKVVESELDRLEAYTGARLYYEALTSGEAIRETKEQLHLGQMELLILIRDQLPKKVGVLRNGMLITDNFERLKRFHDFKDFVAVLRCISSKGNQLLREMEPPRHDSFEPARLMPKKRESQGRQALKEVGQWVREMLKRHARDPASDVTKIDELAEFFSDEETEAEAGKRNEVNPAGAIKIAARRVEPPKPEVWTVTPGEESAGDEVALNTTGQREAFGGGTGGGQGGEGNAGADAGAVNEANAATQGSLSRRPILLRNVRAISLSPGKRRIAFTPSESGRLSVSIEAAGADSNRLLRISSATSAGKVVNGFISDLTVSKDSRVTFDVNLAERYEGAVRVVANAV